MVKEQAGESWPVYTGGHTARTAWMLKAGMDEVIC